MIKVFLGEQHTEYMLQPISWEKLKNIARIFLYHRNDDKILIKTNQNTSKHWKK